MACSRTTVGKLGGPVDNVPFLQHLAGEAWRRRAPVQRLYLRLYLHPYLCLYLRRASAVPCCSREARTLKAPRPGRGRTRGSWLRTLSGRDVAHVREKVDAGEKEVLRGLGQEKQHQGRGHMRKPGGSSPTSLHDPSRGHPAAPGSVQASPREELKH